MRSNVSGSYWIVSGLILLIGGIWIAITINVAGLILAAMGLAAFWLARNSSSFF